MVINFTYEEAIPAIAGTVKKEALVYTTGSDINGKVQLAATSDLLLSDDGIFHSMTEKPVYINNYSDISTFVKIYRVSSQDSEFTWDLEHGSTLSFVMMSDINILFDNVPDDAVVPIVFCKTLWYDELFTYTFNVGTSSFWHNEDSIYYPSTSTSYSNDLIFGYVMQEGVVLRKPLLNMALPYQTNGGVFFNKTLRKEKFIPKRKKPKVSGVEPGMVISGMQNATLNANSVKIDGINGFEALDGSRISTKFLGLKKKFMDASATLNLNVAIDTFIFLNHNMDITSVDITVPDDGLAYTVVLYRTKDDTETPRTMYFDPAIYKLPSDTTLTQKPLANDMITIYCKFGVKAVTFGRNFGTPSGTFKKEVRNG